MFVSDVFKGDTMQHRAFEVHGNQIQDKQDAIRYAKAIATESGKSVLVWESETSLPVAYVGPEIRIRATV